MEIIWDQKFAVGHERIDFEHRIFVGLLMQLSKEIQRDAPRERLLRTLTEIGKYADFHFTSEENIMLDHAYPDYATHAEGHRKLLSTFQDRVIAFRNDAQLPGDLLDFVFEWFALHTTQVDKRLAAYVGQHV